MTDPHPRAATRRMPRPRAGHAASKAPHVGVQEEDEMTVTRTTADDEEVRIRARLVGGESDEEIRHIVAGWASPELLERLAFDDDPDMRAAVAEFASPELLGRMASDEYSYVRRIVAHRIAIEGVERFDDDTDTEVRAIVVMRRREA